MFQLLALLFALQDQPVFRTDVTLVHVDAEAWQDGWVVDGLRKADFVVTDAGKPQRILYFGQQDEPLDVMLLFDDSAQTRLAIERFAGAAHTVIGSLREGDRIGAMTTGHAEETSRARLVADLSDDFVGAERRISGELIEKNAESALRQLLAGIRGAARQFLGQPRAGRRRAIVVVTDDEGAGTAPRLVHNAVQTLWSADAVVMGVIVHSGNAVISIGPPHRGARYAAEETGGDTLSSGDAVEGIREIIRRLRLRSSLDYAMPPGKAGEERKISVKLTPEAAKRYPRAQVRAKRGYIVPEPSISPNDIRHLR
jgi:Ca-activated chloride channel family protein